MNVLHKVTRKAMAKNRVRTVVTVIGIILSTAMFAAVTTMAVSIWDYLVRGAIATSGNFYAEIPYVSDADYDSICSDPKVSHAADYRALGYCLSEDDNRSEFLVASGDDALFDTISFYMKEGRLPKNNTEAVITERIQEILAGQGKPCAVGSLLQLDVQTKPDSEKFPITDVDAKPFTVTYTVVGIYKEYVLSEDNIGLESVLTTQAEEPALWHRVFVRTDPIKSAYDLKYGRDRFINSDLLGMYGITLYSNYNTVIMTFGVILCVIILVGSVSLIYNAFSISVSERMKQYGLISSIGATGKQLRGSVYYEAGVLCVIAVPLGLFFGWLGIAVTLHLLQGNIQDLIAYNEQIKITLRAVPSPVALLSAGVIAVGTVYVSAFIPAARATRVSPMHAIRQQSDYTVSPRTAKTSRWIWKLFGLPGAMARKYYKVSRKKYRATVISLTISVILFVCAATFSGALRTMATRSVATQNYDMLFWGANSDPDVQALRDSEYTAKSAWWKESFFQGVLNADQMSKSAYKVSKEFAEYDPKVAHWKNINVYYLEDTHLEQFLLERGVDPAPYLDRVAPLAVVCQQNVVRYETNGSGKHSRYTETFAPFSDSAGTISLYPADGYPEGLLEFIETNYEFRSWSSSYFLTEDLELGLQFRLGGGFDEETKQELLGETVNFVVRRNDSGVFTYHLMDMQTGEVTQEPAVADAVPAFKVTPGACFNEIPYGLPSHLLNSNLPDYINLILPLSAAPESTNGGKYLSLSVSDYPGIKALIKEKGFQKGGYDDYLEDEQVYRSFVLMVDVFSYGFIVLISAICVANVFNTVSTNIALRRRDFGILRSVGMKMREIYRMLSLECLIYGVKSLVWGLPVSLLFSLYMNSVLDDTGPVVYSPPIGAMGIATACVFAVVFASMAYSVTKVRRESPMDAIRMENI